MAFCPTCGQEYVEGVTTCDECGVALQAEPPADPATPNEHVRDVFLTQDPAEASVVAGLLDASGIAYTQHSGMPQNVLPLHVDRLDAIRIAVAEHDAAAAKALIASRPDEGGAPTP